MVDLTSGLVVAASTIVAAAAAVAAVFGVLGRVARRDSRALRLVRRAHRPAQLLAVTIAARIAATPLVTAGWRGAVEHAVTVAIVVCAAWLVGVGLLGLVDLAVSRFRTDVADNLSARRVHTQVAVIKRIITAILFVFAAGAILTTLPAARAAGAGLLASAGLAGVVAALAAQSMLGNLFAGLHLAFGNSLRLDDVVVVENEWGRIEEITLSYVVVRIWDDRRMILPTTYFTTTPFQNWTKTNASVLGTVEVDVDWTVPLDEMRAQGRRTVEDSPLWDHRAYGLQVTDATGGRIRARLLVSAADSSTLWDLRCLVRERMVTWIQGEHPGAVPRNRTELSGLQQPVLDLLSQPIGRDR